MDIDNNTARLINEVANYALTRSELPRVTRERDACLEACRNALRWFDTIKAAGALGDLAYSQATRPLTDAIAMCGCENLAPQGALMLCGKNVIEIEVKS